MRQEAKTPENRTAIDVSMTPSRFDLAAWGMPDVAYVKPVKVNGMAAVAIFAANGEHLGLATNRDIAFAALVQQDMAPRSVH